MNLLSYGSFEIEIHYKYVSVQIQTQPQYKHTKRNVVYVNWEKINVCRGNNFIVAEHMSRLNLSSHSVMASYSLHLKKLFT